MKIAVLFNCQGHGLAAALQAMLPDAEVDYFSLQQDAESAAIAAGLLAYDHVRSAPVGRACGPPSKRPPPASRSVSSANPSSARLTR